MVDDECGRPSPQLITAQRSLANEAWTNEACILTSRRDWHIVALDLAIEDIRAFEYHGTTGSLADMKVFAEAPSPGARLIARRASVPQAFAISERIKVADRVDLRLPFRTIDLRAGSLEVPRPVLGGVAPRTATPTGLVPLSLGVVLQPRTIWRRHDYPRAG